MLADGSSAYLSEDNGAYVFTTAQAVQQAVPEAERFRVGATTAINGKSYTVASNQAVQLIAAQGELPRLPELGASHAMVELRSQNGAALLGGTTTQVRVAEEVLSIDYSTQPPSVSKGVLVLLEDLKLTGLRAASAKDEKGRQFACPNCGASLTVQLATSKSMTCGSCHSIIDLSQGIGGELKEGGEEGKGRGGGGGGQQQRPTGQLPGHRLPAERKLQRRNQLRAGRVLLAGQPRAKNQQPRLRVRQKPAVHGAVTAGADLVGGRQDRQRRGGQGLPAGG